MEIIINGETKSFEGTPTLLDVIQTLSLEGKVMAAAVNMEIVKQAAWGSHQMKDGDKLELLDFVGGG